MEDRNGILTIGAGLTALILIATGISSVVDGRRSTLETKTELSRQLSEDREKLMTLRAELAHAKTKWAAVEHRRDLDDACEAGRRSITENVGKIRALEAKRNSLKEAVVSTGAAFKNYRADYRAQCWESAIGQTLDELRTRDGKGYRKVMISRVSGEGMEIRHENGVARIPCGNLDPEWHERFQWFPDGTMSALN